MTDLTPDMRASLTEAGILPRFHDVTLADFGVPGLGLLKWLQINGDKIKLAGRSILFHGVGMSDPIIMLNRALHLNGVGCKVVPLVRMAKVLKTPELKEELDDTHVLTILSAQDPKKGCPLYDSTMAEVEVLVRNRFDRKQSTFIHAAVPAEMDYNGPNSYWTDEFWHFAGGQFDLLTEARLNQLASA